MRMVAEIGGAAAKETMTLKQEEVVDGDGDDSEAEKKEAGAQGRRGFTQGEREMNENVTTRKPKVNDRH